MGCDWCIDSLSSRSSGAELLYGDDELDKLGRVDLTSSLWDIRPLQERAEEEDHDLFLGMHHILEHNENDKSSNGWKSKPTPEDNNRPSSVDLARNHSSGS